MTDYLAEVSKRGRSIAVVALIFSSIIFGLGFAGLVAMLISDRPANAEKWRIAVIQLCVSGAFAGASMWMLARLLRRAHSRNGITTMPPWFIELCGIALAGGLLISAIRGGSVWMLIESISVVGAMLFVRRNLRNKRRQLLDEVFLSNPRVGEDDNSP